MFNIVFILIKPYLLNIVYWTAPAKHRVSSTKIKKYSVTKSSKKLIQRDEFLLTLLRLRIGILNVDLADRFCILPALYSRTFTTWIRLLRQLLGHALVVWLPREAILDCTEAFIKQSKSLDIQTYTCSD